MDRNLLALECLPGYRSGGENLIGGGCVPLNPVSKYIEESIAATKPDDWNKPPEPTVLTYVLVNPMLSLAVVLLIILTFSVLRRKMKKK